MAALALRRLHVPLWVRLGVPIALIIALAIGLISFLNYYNYEKTYRQLNVSRITVVARDLRQAIEAGLNVGLSPRNNTQLDSALAIAKDHTAGLRFAVVIDEKANRTVEVGGGIADDKVDPVGCQIDRRILPHAAAKFCEGVAGFGELCFFGLDVAMHVAAGGVFRCPDSD